MPWTILWLAVPSVVAISLLICWRWGLWGVLAPLAALGAVVVFAGPLASWLNDGIRTAMNRFNRKIVKEVQEP